MLTMQKISLIEIFNYMENWQKEFLKIHFEPEHESGITCWCEPKSIVRNQISLRGKHMGSVNHIEHNQQRVILVNFIEKLIEETQIDMITKMSEMARIDPKKCPICGKDLIRDEKNSGPTWASYSCPCNPDLILSVG